MEISWDHERENGPAQVMHMIAAPACWKEEVRSPRPIVGARQVTLQWNLGIKAVLQLVGHRYDDESEGRLLCSIPLSWSRWEHVGWGSKEKWRLFFGSHILS